VSKQESHFPQKGFALVIALSLMSFILLLMLALTAFVRVETQASSTAMQGLSARMNALLGAQIALGKLQAAAGADTRVSALAEILPDSDTFPEGNRFWTGVWRTEGASGTAVYEDTEAVRQWSRDEGPLWLISGDPATNPNLSPDLAISGDRRILSRLRSDNGTLERVSAGLVPISPNNNAFAYYVFDHSVRPDANLTPAEGRVNPASGSLAERINVMAPARSGLPARLSGFTTTDAMAWRSLGRITRESEWNFLPQFDSENQAEVEALTGGRYSFGSLGLLTDTRRGGLRKDLSRYLINGEGLSNATPMVNAQDYTNLPSGASLPNWGIAREWYQAGAGLSGHGGSAPYIAAQGADNFGIHPLLAAVELRFGFGYEAVDVSAAEDPEEIEHHAVLLAFPRVDLWNPYNVTLPAQDYVLRIRSALRIGIDDRGLLHTEQRFGRPNSGKEYEMDGRFDLNAWLLDGQAEPYLELLVRAPAIPPGRVLPFFIDGSQVATYARSAPSATPAMVNEPWGDTFVAIPTGIRISPNIAHNNVTYLTFYEPIGDDEMQAELRLPNGTLLMRKHDPRVEFANTRNTIAINTFGDAVIRQYIPGQGYLGDVPAGGTKATIHGSFWFADDSSGRYSNRIWVNFSLRQTFYDQTDAPLDPLQLHYQNEAVQNINQLDAAVTLSDGLDVAYALYNRNRGLDDNNLHQYVFYEIPRTAASGTGVFSLGQLQHLPLARHYWHPEHALGNAWAHPWIPRERYSGFYDGNADPGRILDLSYLINESVWDRYFLSGWRDSGSLPTSEALPSGVLAFTKTPASSSAFNDFNTAAHHLAIKGAFNVNTASVEAWRDLLRAGRDLNATAANGDDLTPADRTPYSRFHYPLLGNSPIDGQHRPINSTRGGDIGIHENWAGMRALTDEEIDALAAAIVEQVRLRGPFLSLADFINRQRIAADGADPLGRSDRSIGLSGTLQAAIDRVSQPSDPNNILSGGILNAEFNFNSFLSRRRNSSTDAGVAWTRPEALSHSSVRQHEHWLGVAFGQVGHRQAGIPGYLTQADVLNVIAPRLTARGDTFTLIAYGEKDNARARCEMVVRRTADWIDPANDPVAASNEWTPENAAFGRRFEVVSFRWLDPDIDLTLP
jgi:hypothetical protein